MKRQHGDPEVIKKELAQLQKINTILHERLTEKDFVIDAYKERETYLQKTLQRTLQIKNILDANTIVVITDTEGKMQYVNDKFCELTQYTREELLGKNTSIINSNHHAKAFFNSLWKTITNGKTWKGELKNKAKDGSYFWVDMVIIPLPDESGKPGHYMAIRRDITNDKQSQEILHFNAFILAHVDDAIVGVDHDFRVNYWNGGARKLYGLESEEVIGKLLNEAYQSIWINEEDEAQAMIALEKQGACKVTIIHKLRNGEEIFVEATTQIVKNEDGTRGGMLAVIRNVTDRTQTEQELKKTLHELEKRNYELDNYVYKVSHDLKAPLSSMKGLLNLIKLEEDTTAKEHYLQLIESRVVKLDDIILSILHHAKILKTETIDTLIDFEEIIKECHEEISHYSNWEKINLTIRVEHGADFFSDAFRITVIIRNIVSNAIKYMNISAENCYVHFDIKTTDTCAFLVIQDNGIGIDAEFLSNIFDMFFRAATISEGSGIGLYIVKQATEMLGGNIRVESKKGAGTTFLIELPNKFSK